MRLHVMSDLHLEHHRDNGKSFIASLNQKQEDLILVLAGDVTNFKTYKRGLDHLKAISGRYRKVFYVPGNHEFYGAFPYVVTALMDQLSSDIQNLTVLKSDSPVEFEGKRFLGDTLWFKNSDAITTRMKACMSDFSLIKKFEPWVYDTCVKTIDNLYANMRHGDIVVTHHLPHKNSVHPKYFDDEFNAFFLCDLEPLILERQPMLWLHGHTHEKFDYKVGGTRIASNALGYPLEGIEQPFNDNLVIEV